MKVKCINNEACIFLTLDKEYEVIKSHKEQYVIINDSRNYFGYFKSRFEIAKENDNMELTIKQKIESLEKQIKELKDQIKDLDLVENNKKVWWTPKIDEEYWFVDSQGDISKETYEGFRGQNFDISIGNCFKTKKQAERDLFERQLRFKLKKFAYENNEKEINWNNRNQKKYSITYDFEDKTPNSIIGYFARRYGQIYFTSQKVVEKAIETFKDDLIRYFTSDK